MRVKLTYFKNDYDDDDKFKKLDPRRAELAGNNRFLDYATGTVWEYVLGNT